MKDYRIIIKAEAKIEYLYAPKDREEEMFRERQKIVVNDLLRVLADQVQNNLDCGIRKPAVDTSETTD